MKKKNYKVACQTLSLGASLGAWFQGQGASSPSNFELSTLLNGTGKEGTVINGISTNDLSGYSVDGAGDINGDGIDDILIGALKYSLNNQKYIGQSYVIFGKKGGLGSVLELNSLNGTNGFTVNGSLGYAAKVSNAGDINGDGLNDIIIGAWGAAPNGKSAAGQSYVLFGKKGNFNATLELSSLDGINGFALNGISTNDFSGISVSGAGDFNGDGFDDILIGAGGASNKYDVEDAGQSYLIFGKKEKFEAILELSDLNGTNGFSIHGFNMDDGAGYSVSGAGDINGDGLDDVIIGAKRATSSNYDKAGRSFIIFGRREGLESIFSLNPFLLNITNCLVINGVQEFEGLGYSNSGIGDINGDGADDILISSLASGLFSFEQSYLIFGRKNGFDDFLPSEVGEPNFYVTKLDGINGFKLYPAPQCSISGAGDINHDGIDDFIIGNGNTSPNEKEGAGKCYVVFGQKKNKFELTLDLNALESSSGFVINGIEAGDRLGSSVSKAGDVNGDGIDDLIIGAASASPNGKEYAGQSYVIYGRDSSPQGDFTKNWQPDFVIQRPDKTLGIIPLIVDTNNIVRSELTGADDFPLFAEIIPNPLLKKTKFLAALDFDDKGVSDILVQNKKQLKIYRLDNNGSPVSPTLMGEIDFNSPKRHRYVGAGTIVGDDNKIDLIFKKGKRLSVAKNLGNFFSESLQDLEGRLSGKLLAVQKDRIITAKGSTLSQQTLTGTTLGAKKRLGKLLKGQKPVLMLDINQDDKLEIITLNKKREIGFIKEEELGAIPTPILTLSKKTKLIGPQ